MAEFEQTTRPSTIAAHWTSAVKRKSKSPTFTEQTQTKSAPPRTAVGDAPSQGAPKKRRGGKGKGKAWAHAIVSSALVPLSVTKRLQETHHVAAPVPAPTNAPIVASTVVGGPLRAPITQVPATIASSEPAGITYTKQEVPKSMQVFTKYIQSWLQVHNAWFMCITKEASLAMSNQSWCTFILIAINAPEKGETKAACHRPRESGVATMTLTSTSSLSLNWSVSGKERNLLCWMKISLICLETLSWKWGILLQNITVNNSSIILDVQLKSLTVSLWQILTSFTMGPFFSFLFKYIVFGLLF